jgi:peptidoglycan/LPS O-acetylase OafA/YrhL
MPVILFTRLAAPGLRGMPFLAAVFGLTLLLAALSWHLFERPLSQYFRRRVAQAGRRGQMQLA